MTFQLSAILNYLCHHFRLFAHVRSDHGKWLYYNYLSDKTLAPYSFIYKYFFSIALLFTTMAGAMEDREALDKLWLLLSRCLESNIGNDTK